MSPLWHLGSGVIAWAASRWGNCWKAAPGSVSPSRVAWRNSRTSGALLVVNDLHRHIINLATVAADPVLAPQLYRQLRRLPLHPDVLAQAQQRCVQRERDGLLPASQLDWAVDYFVCAWMSRQRKAGTASEFSGRVCVRWEAAGGDTAVRFRSATSSLLTWRRILARATFTSHDAFEMLGKCKDRPRHGIYCDPPFPGPGDSYRYKFGVEQHTALAVRLAEFKDTASYAVSTTIHLSGNYILNPDGPGIG